MRHNKKEAFTLPEVMLTIAILASVILYFILAFSVTKYATQLSKARLVVNNLLREEMENVLNTAYATVDQLAGTQTIDISDGVKTMTITKTIPLPETPDAGIYGYKKVYVKMEWIGGATKNKTLEENAILYVTKE